MIKLFVCFVRWTISIFSDSQSDLLTSSESRDDIFLFSLIDKSSTINIIANNYQYSVVKLLNRRHAACAAQPETKNMQNYSSCTDQF